jgi:hypothetical protein
MAGSISACGSSSSADQHAPSSTDGGGGVDVKDATSSDPIDLVAVLDRTVVVDPVTAELTFSTRSDGEKVGQTVTGTVDFAHMLAISTVRAGPASLDLRSVGERTWIRSDDPQFEAALPAGVQWIEAPTATLVQRGVISLSPEVTWAPFYFLAGARDVRDQGDGVYSFVVDLSAVGDAITPSQRKAWRATLQDLSDPELVGSVTGTVRVDSEGRAVELRLEVTSNDAAVGSDGTVVLATKLRDIGSPVSVHAPPPSEVATVEAHPELLELLTGPGPGY